MQPMRGKLAVAEVQSFDNPNLHMACLSTCSFVAAHFSTKKCELWLNADRTAIIAYVPTREGYEGKLKLGTASFAAAEVAAREMGLEPTWGV